jgi:hypothetical protein
MDIIIASIRDDLINSIKLLLEIEIKEIVTVSRVSTRKELLDHINYDSPDMIIIFEDFLGEYEKVMDYIYQEYQEVDIVIIGNRKIMDDRKLIADKYIVNDSPAVIDNLIRIARGEIEKIYI